MRTETENMLAAMNRELETIAHTTPTVAEIAWRSLLSVMRHLIAYKKRFASFDFNDTGNQIYFYKTVQPAYFQQLFYFFDLLSMESSALLKEPGAMHLYYRQQLERAGLYLEQHSFFRTYLAEEKTHLDDALFTQISVQIPVYPDNDDFRDSAYFNFNSFVVAKIAAYQRLALYLTSRIPEGFSAPAHGIPPLAPPDCASFLAILQQDQEMNSLYEEMIRKMNWLQSSPQEGATRYVNAIRRQKLAGLHLWQTLRSRYLERYHGQ